MEQTQIVENQDSGSNVDKTEVEKHQDSVSGAGVAEADPKADKNDKESGSGPSGSGSSAPDPFRVFTQDGTMFRVRGNQCGSNNSQEELHFRYVLGRRRNHSGGRAQTVHKYCGIVQNAHVKTALYGGSRDEIAQILVHGFSAANANDGAHGCVQLVPAALSLDAALFCEVDEAELRHVLVCRVILGRVQLVPDGSNHVGPRFRYRL
ncbi:putative inactive poly [ADP-ribose] polymerase SRO2 [Rosa sericea]